jgi:cell division protein FtsX
MPAGLLQRRTLDDVLPEALRRVPSSASAFWLTGLLVFLATAALIVSLASDAWLQRRAALPRSAVVSIPADPQLGERQARAELVLATLRADPAVAFAAPVPDDQVQAMVDAWSLGEPTDPQLLPALIDVSLARSAEADLELLAQKLHGIVPGTALEEVTPEAGRAVEIARLLRVIALAAVVVALAGAVAAVALGARQAIRQRREVVLLLRQMGASDRVLLRWAERAIMRRGAAGALAGTGLAALCLVGVAVLARAGVLPAATAPSTGPAAWLLLVLVPALALALGGALARIVGSETLRRL